MGENFYYAYLNSKRPPTRVIHIDTGVTIIMKYGLQRTTRCKWTSLQIHVNTIESIFLCTVRLNDFLFLLILRASIISSLRKGEKW